MATGSENSPTVQFSLLTDLREVFGAVKGGAVGCIDIPIGLAENGARPADLAARAALPKGRTSSIFPTPTRSAASATTYRQACDANVVACGKKISKQAWNILPKIREIDDLLRADPLENFRETHPEVVFAILANGALIPGKKTEEGETIRLRLLRSAGLKIDVRAIGAAREQLGLGNLHRDDLVDAAACLIAARRFATGTHRCFPQNPATDRFGLLMQIVA